MAIVVPAAAQSGYVLSNYQTQVRRLLHDTTGKMYSNSIINDNINAARDRVARDSCCVRFMQTNAQYGINLTQGVEAYTVYSFLPLGSVTVDVLGVSIYWGNQRVKLKYLPFTQFDAWLRSYTTYQALPVAFSRYAGVVYIGPVPNQTYAVDFDTALIPNVMYDDTTPEQIIEPFQGAVAFYAAHLCKLYEQSQGEAAIYLQQYRDQMRNRLATYQRRTIQNPYPSGQ